MEGGGDDPPKKLGLDRVNRTKLSFDGPEVTNYIETV